jgi:hypothetical protein
MDGCHLSAGSGFKPPTSDALTASLLEMRGRAPNSALRYDARLWCWRAVMAKLTSPSRFCINAQAGEMPSMDPTFDEVFAAGSLLKYSLSKVSFVPGYMWSLNSCNRSRWCRIPVGGSAKRDVLDLPACIKWKAPAWAKSANATCVENVQQLGNLPLVENLWAYLTSAEGYFSQSLLSII